MNCPSRPDSFDTEAHPDWNQNPQHLNSDATTRADLNGVVNRRAQRNHDDNPSLDEPPHDLVGPAMRHLEPGNEKAKATGVAMEAEVHGAPTRPISSSVLAGDGTTETFSVHSSDGGDLYNALPWYRKISHGILKYIRFVGPGFLIAVAYIDPGNYATDVQAGATTQFAHLFIVLMSNLIAIFLQSLCIKLGTVTGLDLAENCRKHLPKWLVWCLYALSEGAIIATDIAEVIGTAIALNLLLKIPLVAGCAISLLDVFLLLLFYNPDGSMTRLRIFEFLVMFLVLGVVVCFCIELTYIRNVTIGSVFRGYLPSSDVINNNGIYLSCGILGATVMPHSIYLGSGLVQPRLRNFDEQHSDGQIAHVAPHRYGQAQDSDEKYRPSIGAIKSCMKFSIIELALQLFTFALFVNSSILIVAGASLYGSSDAAGADLFGIHDLLARTIAPAAGILFALALLLSGTSAGIVCTMAGQMVSEGMLRWKLKPWLRRLVTRSISIMPSIVVAGTVGKSGLNNALTGSQVALSVALPFVTAPLLWFTCSSAIMTVNSDAQGRRLDGPVVGANKVNMRNHWLTSVVAVAVWLLLVIMNVALIVLAATGK